MLGWDWYRFDKKCVGICYAELVFLHPVGSVGHVVFFGASRARNVDAHFSCSGGRCGFLRKRDGTRYAEPVFLHLVGSAGKVVDSGASGAQNIDTIFFMLGWNRYRFRKNASGYVTLKLCFCIQLYLWVT
jgi:hypothetical protein